MGPSVLRMLAIGVMASHTSHPGTKACWEVRLSGGHSVDRGGPVDGEPRAGIASGLLLTGDHVSLLACTVSGT